MKARLIIAIAASLLFSNVAQAAEIKLIAAGAVKNAYLELFPEFEKATGHKVVAEWSGTPDIQKRILAGEAVDVIILGNKGADELVKQGKLSSASRVDFAKSGIAVAVRAGAPKPDISSADAVKKSLLAAKSVAYSAGASGVYIVSMFEKLGIADQMKSKAFATKSGELVGDVVARGDAAIGFQQVSELILMKGLEYLGPLPPEIQNITVFSGGIHSQAKAADTAAALVKFLTAPAALSILKKYGLEPG